MGYVVGQDIGYSNLKIAFGTSDGEMTTVIRPAGAAPKEHFGSRFDGKKQDEGTSKNPHLPTDTAPSNATITR